MTSSSSFVVEWARSRGSFSQPMPPTVTGGRSTTTSRVRDPRVNRQLTVCPPSLDTIADSRNEIASPPSSRGGRCHVGPVENISLLPALRSRTSFRNLGAHRPESNSDAPQPTSCCYRASRDLIEVVMRWACPRRCSVAII
jgi:hypothetical protein